MSNTLDSLLYCTEDTSNTKGYCIAISQYDTRWVCDVYSEYLELDGLRWRLRLYAYGSFTTEGTDLIACVELYSGEHESATFHFEIVLVNADNSKNISFFEFADFSNPGYTPRHHKIYDVSSLKKDGFVTNNCFAFRLSIKYATFFDKYKVVNRNVPKGPNVSFPIANKTFILDNFSYHKKRGKNVFSDVLKLDRISWILDVYPNGHDEAKGNYLSVYVKFCGGYDGSAEFDIFIELVNRNGLNVSYTCRELFNKSYNSFGNKKMYELSLLEQDGFLVDDSIELKFSIKYPTIMDRFRVLESFENEVPPYWSKDFYLENYSYYKERCQIVYSDILNLDGMQWRLLVYPNGVGLAKGRYVSAFIELVDGLNGSANFDYEIKLINNDDLKTITFQSNADFCVGGFSSLTHEMCDLSLLVEDGFLVNDSLSFTFSVKYPTVVDRITLLENLCLSALSNRDLK